MTAAFYLRDGDRFVPTELTRGPWDPGSQHAGPPAALIGRAVERLPADGPMQVGRLTFEILRPVPIAPLEVRAALVRPGRSVQLAEATLSDEDGEVIRARAWRLRVSELAVPPELGGSGQGVLPGPEEGREVDFLETGQAVGYHTAMEYRFVSGAFRERGPATAWMRMRWPLVEGEQPSPLQRVLCAADSGNGVSATLDWNRWLFINVDLTVHLHRLPEDEWVCLDSVTIAERNGSGMADTALHDRSGRIGRALQTLLVGERAPGGQASAP